MTTNTPWTPGPWTSDGTTSASKGWPIVNSQWGEVARFAYSGDDQAQANADICALAPEMAETLAECITEEGAAAFLKREYAEQRLRYITEIARAILARLPQKGGEK